MSKIHVSTCDDTYIPCILFYINILVILMQLMIILYWYNNAILYIDDNIIKLDIIGQVIKFYNVSYILVFLISYNK